ncbi:MAG: folate-binding protein [Gammaproteobacteria bacterium]
MPRSVALDDLRILAVTGSDRAAFLQGQLTQDVATARPDLTVMAGWADAKGRLLFAGHLFVARLGTDEALALLVPADLADALLKRLRMYILRAKAQATLLDVPLAGLIGAPADPGASQCVRLHGHGERHLLLGGPAAHPGDIAGPRSDWRLSDIRAGLPAVVAATTGEFVPQMVNLDLLGGISFTKGCYTGQEIVARMKYLGRVKRRMLRFGTPGDAPAPGAQLYASRGAVGQVVTSAPAESGSEFLAVVVVDDLPGPFFLDGTGTLPVLRLELPYEVPL